ncbi:MAG: 3-oxoacyl-ACP synthase [Cyclobacteriaceae bacterium]|jgi:transcription elongation GreA/GreB family factor|nr:3-oxoacyl-ACP synthase [Cyclobacteriaceae bacterium]
MMTKSVLYEKCMQIVDEKIKIAQDAMLAAQDSANAEGKSTAGDKYDTARAMSHIERDMYAKQLAESLQLKKVLDEIDVTKKSEKIKLGSLVKTSMGNYFLSAGLGIIKLEEETVFALSPFSPIGNLILGKKIGDSVIFKGQQIEIFHVE